MARTEWRGGERYFWVLFLLGILVVGGLIVVEQFLFFFSDSKFIISLNLCRHIWKMVIKVRLLLDQFCDNILCLIIWLFSLNS
jgi:hypothetical protein